ncbi:hypothetical protein EJ06DRAFT_523341 [Trichodelitschia bisporula]|uniref:Uncharacterized protein n=1 Tax=Trichodelitschia bisporula TaxID=703511 RepID=A0A6G1HR63_9PEZI|nr:hypothetical protein EJ06DRAFT_523341 [Trichodelitschia bisporula]
MNQDSSQDGSQPASTLVPGTPTLQPQTEPFSSHLERAKFASPAPVQSASLTPPPSSQLLVRSVARTPSPPTSHLESPPPTHRAALASDVPTPDQVRDASVDELRGMVERLSVALREARTSAAHYKLQHNMLLIDSSEASKRMAVELTMAQREVDVLQEAEEKRRIDSPQHPLADVAAANTNLIRDLTRHCSILQAENDELRRALGQAHKAVEYRDGQLLGLEEENERLRHRIRKNREHMNGLLDSVHESPRSLAGTPRNAPTSTPRTLPPRHFAQPTPPHRDNQPFEALLLADKVLSQETATAPSTPKPRPIKHRLGHTRNTHSLSSLPSTPPRYPQTLRTPPALAAILEPPVAGAPLYHQAASAPARRRRASSDSTITASSEDDLPESQASQAASNMLRATAKGRIVGRVSKPGSDKEKRRVGDKASPTKRSKLGVGLGIGEWVASGDLVLDLGDAGR